MNGIGLTSRSDVRLPPPTTDSIAGDLANNETPNLKSYNRGFNSFLLAIESIPIAASS